MSFDKTIKKGTSLDQRDCFLFQGKTQRLKEKYFKQRKLEEVSNHTLEKKYSQSGFGKRINWFYVTHNSFQMARLEEIHVWFLPL